jgi:hypothetical protein
MLRSLPFQGLLLEGFFYDLFLGIDAVPRTRRYDVAESPTEYSVLPMAILRICTLYISRDKIDV